MYHLTFIPLSIVSISLAASLSTQSDWSGGDGYAGPAAQWGDQYYSANSVCTGIAGEVTLGAMVDPEINPLNLVCGETSIWVDVSNDGFTDVVCLNTAGDSLYWLENPVTQGAPWARHHITAREHIWDFGEVMYFGEFYGVAVAYTISYLDDTQVGYIYGPSSGGFWSLADIGTLGEKDYTVSLVTGDLDNNGCPDIVAAEWAYDNVAVWWNCAAGIPQSIIGSHTPYVTQLEDCDSDGDLEVFIETSWTPSSRIYWNSGSGFSLQYIDDCYYTSRKAVADLDGGSFCEIAFSMFNDMYIYRYVPGNGWVLEKIASNTSSPVFYDINGDSEKDLITCNCGQLTYLYNLGQGNAWREGSLAAGLPSRIAVTDIDGDSVPDITLYSPYGQAYWFLPQGEGFAAEGFLESTWLSPEADSAWETISFESSGASGTSVTAQVRSASDISSPPEWSPELPSGSDITAYCSEDDEYFQYRLNLYSNSADETPTVTSFSLDWTTDTDIVNDAVDVVFRPVDCPSETPILLIQLPFSSICTIDIFDVSGRMCRSYTRGVSPMVMDQLIISDLPCGVYNARLTADGHILCARFAVVAP